MLRLTLIVLGSLLISSCQDARPSPHGWVLYSTTNLDGSAENAVASFYGLAQAPGVTLRDGTVISAADFNHRECLALANRWNEQERRGRWSCRPRTMGDVFGRR